MDQAKHAVEIVTFLFRLDLASALDLNSTENYIRASGAGN
jgi:hypothetical protein